MKYSALCPPNSLWLSDEVITRVEERSIPRSLSYSRKYDQQAISPEHSNEALWTSSASIYVEKPNFITTFSATTHSVSSEGAESSTKKLHRERRRLTQIRYRRKLRNRGVTLEMKVQLLQEEVFKLESQCQSLAPRIIASTTPWNVMAEYFRLFRYGLTAYVPISERCSTDTPHHYEARMYREFLEATMAADVIVDGQQGVDTMLMNWRFISISQPNIDIQAIRLENGPGDSTVATTKAEVIICESMLRHAFPHLAKSDRGRLLAAKLLDQRFTLDGSTVFSWDIM